MKTALELLKSIKSDLSVERYNQLKYELEEEEFKEEFENAFRGSFRYDSEELREAVSQYSNEDKDKIYFIQKLYYRSELKEFLNKYWNRMNQIIVMVYDRLNKLDEENKEEN